MDQITVLEASTRLGLRPGTVRKAWRKGRITGTRIAARPGWSFLLLDRASVEAYARIYLGHHGAQRQRCTECGRVPSMHRPSGHVFAAPEEPEPAEATA